MRATWSDDAAGAAGSASPLRAFALERVQCRLGNAPIDIANQFNNPFDPATNPNGYQPNLNPALAQLTLTPGAGGASVALAPIVTDAPVPPAISVAPGQRVVLEGAWTSESVETFPAYDLASVTLIPHREALRISWFATAGTFDHDVTGRGEDDAALSVSNGWLAPSAPGMVYLWLVLRDSRGGVDFASYALDVSP